MQGFEPTTSKIRIRITYKNMNFADELYLFNLTSYFKTKPLGSNSAAIRNAQHCNLRAALNRYSSTFYSSFQ